MAEAARQDRGADRWVVRLRPGQADAVLVAAVTYIVAEMVQSDWEERALALIARARPMAGGTAELAALREAADALLAAGPLRNQRGEGRLVWARAVHRARAAVAQRAMARAMAGVE